MQMVLELQSKKHVQDQPSIPYLKDIQKMNSNNNSVMLQMFSYLLMVVLILLILQYQQIFRYLKIHIFKQPPNGYMQMIVKLLPMGSEGAQLLMKTKIAFSIIAIDSKEDILTQQVILHFLMIMDTQILVHLKRLTHSLNHQLNKAQYNSHNAQRALVRTLLLLMHLKIVWHLQEMTLSSSIRHMVNAAYQRSSQILI